MKLPIIRRVLATLLAFAALPGLPVIAQTVTYSLADDFTYDTNLPNDSNSPWSYRLDDWQSNPQTFLPLLDTTDHNANEVWGTDFMDPPKVWSLGADYWAIGKNLSGDEQYSAITGTFWEPGDVLFWPKGGNTAPSRMVIGWTSPHKGVMDVYYTFDRASEVGNGIGYSLAYRTGGTTSDLVGFTQIGVTYTDQQSGLPVNKGDQLFFRFDSWGPFEGDISRASIVITVTPDTYSAKPEIISQPAGGTAVVGRSFTFSVSATGDESYQWQKDGTPISGATSTSYTINNLKESDAGVYSVVVSNPLGPVTSNEARLEVVKPVVQMNYSLAGDFSITDNGNMNAWSYGYDNTSADPVQFVAMSSNTQNANDLWGADFPNPPLMWSSDATSYGGIGKNTSGVAQTSSSGITWNPDEVLLRPKTTDPFPGRLTIVWTAPADLVISLNYTFAQALNAGGVGYSLVKRASEGDAFLVNWTGASSAGPLSNSIDQLAVSAGDKLFWRIDSWGGAEEDDITKASISISVKTFDKKPEIVSQPQGGNGFLGASFTFSVSATDAQSYQWLKNGNPIEGATDSNYTIASLTESDGGSYAVTVSNVSGAVTSNEAVFVVARPEVVSTYSLSGDFSLSDNGAPNPWSYGMDGIPGEPIQFLSLTNNTLNANDLWGTDFTAPPMMWSSDTDTGETGYWAIGKNTSGEVQTSSSGITWEPGVVMLRPKATGPFPGRLVIGWTSPANNTVNLVYSFSQGLEAGGVGYSLVKRTSKGDEFLVNWNGPTSGGALANSMIGIPVSAGDQLFWRIDSWGEALEDDITKAAIEIQALGVAPALRIQHAENQNAVIVSWPASAANYALQRSTSITGPFDPYDGTVSTIGAEFSVTAPIVETSAFFRLVKP
jgi:hypothetical protein